MSSPRNEIQEIYCDESGFTGNNLLDEETPFFAYAAVAVSHEEAKEFVEKTIRDYKVQTNELKFQKLIKYARGKQAIMHVLETFSTRTKVAISNKKYNLACKFYEYIFEPTVASKNYIFYDLGFHKFISSFLYLHFQHKNKYAEVIFEDFYRLMKAKDDQGLTYLFSSLAPPNISPLLDTVKTFCIHQREAINTELDSLKGTGVGKWILDLSHSSLFSLLSEWGQEFYQLKVFCDASKPLQEQMEVFQVMVNREETLFIKVAGKEHPFSFNLVSIPKLVNSQSHPGIQIADIFAGIFTFVFRESLRGNYKNYFDNWMPHLDGCISPYSVLPDLELLDELLDLEEINVQRNYLILEELRDRSVRKVPLLDRIEVFLAYLNYHLYRNSKMMNPEM